jgi:transcriptional regulator with AAA-type ATPase domain
MLSSVREERSFWMRSEIRPPSRPNLRARGEELEWLADETIRSYPFIVATNKTSRSHFDWKVLEDSLPAHVVLPPLRERREDVPDLVSYFLNKFNRELKKKIVGITPPTMEKITSYGWPGNVRHWKRPKRAMISARERTWGSS